MDRYYLLFSFLVFNYCLAENEYYTYDRIDSTLHAWQDTFGYTPHSCNQYSNYKFGIIYTTLAGFDVNASLSIIDKAVESGEGVHHPSKETRMEKLNERIGEFVATTDYFHAGVKYFENGQLDYAEKAFRSGDP